MTREDCRENRATLEKLCEERSVIRPVSRHRKADGTIDREGNIVARMEPTMDMKKVMEKVEEVL